MITTTYAVYSVTLRGSFTTKYEGASEDEALTAYNKLVDASKPRCLTRREKLSSGATSTSNVMLGGGFPQ